MLKFFTKEVEVYHKVPEYIILDVDNFNKWFINPNNNAIYANSGIFLRTDKLSISHVLDYMDVCYGIKAEQASISFDIYKFFDLIRNDWRTKILLDLSDESKQNISQELTEVTVFNSNSEKDLHTASKKCELVVEYTCVKFAEWIRTFDSLQIDKSNRLWFIEREVSSSELYNAFKAGR